MNNQMAIRRAGQGLDPYDTVTAPAPRPAAVDTYTVPLTSRDIEKIEGIADLGMPIGGTLVGRLCADWRRLTAERDAALAALPDADDLGYIADFLSGSDVYSESFLSTLRHGFAASLRRKCDAIRALNTAPAPVTAADVPPFLAHLLNGGQ